MFSGLCCLTVPALAVATGMSPGLLFAFPVLTKLAREVPEVLFEAEDYWLPVAFAAFQFLEIFEWRRCGCPAAASSPAASARSGRDAIVMLVQKKREALLARSLRHLGWYFTDCFHKDIILFHRGDFSFSDQVRFKALHGPRIQFHRIKDQQWSVPACAGQRGAGQLVNGYKHMCRWNAISLHDYVAELGYDWYLRLDDDSKITSCIDYDLFEFMERHNFSYGFRLMQREGWMPGDLPGLAALHLAESNLSVPGPLANRFAENRVMLGAWDRWYFFNNFMLTRVSFWRSAAVQLWLRRVDCSGMMFACDHDANMCVGDGPIQTFTVLMFMPRRQLWRFDNFSYTHYPLSSMAFPSGTVMARILEWLPECCPSLVAAVRSLHVFSYRGGPLRRGAPHRGGRELTVGVWDSRRYWRHAVGFWKAFFH